MAGLASGGRSISTNPVSGEHLRVYSGRPRVHFRASGLDPEDQLCGPREAEDSRGHFPASGLDPGEPLSGPREAHYGNMLAF